MQIASRRLLRPCTCLNDDQYIRMHVREITYNSLISSAYKSRACGRMIVPLAARGSGLLGSATKIISLSKCAYGKETRLASSITGLAQTMYENTAAMEKKASYQILFLNSDSADTWSSPSSYPARGSIRTPHWVLPRPNITAPLTIGLALIIPS
jgi:hypothetical protein